MTAHPGGARFVLVRPRNPNHVGAVARAMANFGFQDLRVVDPYEPIWLEARSGVGAREILLHARAGSLDEALEGARLVLGTSDGRRKLRRPLVPLPGLADYLRGFLPEGCGAALLFGPEKTGLGNRELQRCHALVRVPTRSECPSMNLAQAAAVIAYELSRSRAPARPLFPRRPRPTVEQMEDLVGKGLAAMRRLDYMRNVPEPAKSERLRSMFLGWRLERRDAAWLQALLGRMAVAPPARGEG